MRWIIKDKNSDSLIEHLREQRRGLDFVDYGNHPLLSFYGYLIPDEKIMKDIIKAGERIIQAVNTNEKIVIFGHDDADGITSTYILFDFLSSIGCQSHFYYIPNRMIDHYGLQGNFINFVKERKFSLVVTVDGGISSVEGVEELKSIGCETIITDHHTIPNALPDAYAIVNPKLVDCPYPYDMLAGVGVTYFLVKMMARILNRDIPDKYLFWTALGSIADKAPLTGINRIICKVVFDNWERMIDRPISLWVKTHGNTDRDYFSKMSFISNFIRLISNGRDENGEHLSLYFLLSPDYKKREIISELLSRKNSYESDLIKAKTLIDVNLPDENQLYHIYWNDESQIPYSLLGWTASYLTSIYKIPVLMITEKSSSAEKEPKLFCEARCSDGFDLIAAFNYAAEALEQYGGHTRAAGFVLPREKKELFLKLFDEFVNQKKEEIEDNRIIIVDAEINREELNCIREIVLAYAPYGEGAQSPVFLVKNISLPEFWQKTSLRASRNIPADILEEDAPVRIKEITRSEQGEIKLYDVVFTVKTDGKPFLLDTKKSSGADK